MLQFCSVSNSLSHTTLSIKWEVYFSKRLCRTLLLCRHYDFACRCVSIVGHDGGYTTYVYIYKICLSLNLYYLRTITSTLPDSYIFTSIFLALLKLRKTFTQNMKSLKGLILWVGLIQNKFNSSKCSWNQRKMARTLSYIQTYVKQQLQSYHSKTNIRAFHSKLRLFVAKYDSHMDFSLFVLLRNWN